MAIKGIEPDEIPLGSSVWIECRAVQSSDLSRYRKKQATKLGDV
jgi:hypothetical protein